MKEVEDLVITTTPIEEEEQEMEIKIEKQRFDAAKGVILTGWVLLMLTCVGIIISNVYMWVNQIPVPETLTNWGSAVIGFLFGSFISLLKEFISDKE